MRAVTQNFLLGLLAVVVLLLALGALPSLLASGDPYYLVATEVDDGDRTAVDVGNFSERRFPYTTRAIETGRSEAYYDGPVGIKESFTHSPFDELDALEQRDRDADNRDAGAVNGSTAFVRKSDTVYRLELVRGGETPNGS
ncbi:hypothetical protein [Halomarina litorea]|uniref:hypothetical protein n=1 Tax=Halomarina litorea TaxID=2961595 RepID=UPI0020C3D54D|nr:hypothetical protein [Halomarina sp. BCD28]